MASHHFAQYSSASFESPAKVFAKLKSKLQREAGNEVPFPDNEWRAPEKHGGVFLTPRKRSETPSTAQHHRQMFGNGDVTAVTLSPISSPQKNTNYRYEEDELSHMRDMERAFRRGEKYVAPDKHGGVFLTPRKRTESHCTTRDTRQQQRFVNSEVAPVTLSPISSPENICSPEEDQLSQILEMEHAFRLRKPYMSKERAFVEAYLESTAVCNPTNMSSAFQQSHVDRQERAEPAEVLYCESGVLKEGAGHPLKLSTDTVFSPMRKRLRKRHWEEQALPTSLTNTRTSEVNYGPCPAKGRKMSRAVSDDDYIRNMNSVGGRTHPEESTMAPVHTGHVVAVEKASTNHMTPTKMFNSLVERGNRPGQGDGQKVTSSVRRPTDCDNDSKAGMAADSPGSSVDSMGSSDSEGVRDEPAPGVPSQPVLHEDPLVLNSPRFSIPQKQVSVFRRATVSHCSTIPDDNVVHLRKWHLRRNKKGLFVDGIHREKNLQWHSNIIMSRVSNTVLKTVTGRVYILVGKMTTAAPTQFPKWFLKSFTNGFPQNWKELYNKYLSMATGNQEMESQSDKGSTKSKASLNLSVKRPRQRSLNTSEPCSSSTVSSVKVSRSGRLIKPPLEYWKGGRVLLDAQMNVTIHEGYDTTITQSEATIVSPNPPIPSKKPVAVKVSGSKACDLHESISNPKPVVLLRKVKVPPRKPHKTQVGPDGKPPSPKENGPADTEENEGGASQSALKNAAKKTSKHKKAAKGVKQSSSSPTLPQPSTNEETSTDAKRTSRSRSKKSSSSNSEENDSDKRKKENPKNNGKTQAGRKRGTTSLLSAKPSTQQDAIQTHTKGNTNKKARNKSKNTKVKGQPSASSKSPQVNDKSPKTDEEKPMDRAIQRDSHDRFRKSTSCSDSEENEPNSKKKQPRNNVKTQKGKTKTPKPSAKRTQPSKTRNAATGNTQASHEQDEEEWTEEELKSLEQAVAYYPKHLSGYWTKVARLVGTRSADECHNRHTSMGTSKTPPKASKKKKAPSKDKVVDQPVINARAGTWRRKKQEREFLEAMPKEDMDDVFSSAYMQNKRFEVPSMCPSDDQDFSMSDLEPLTPRSTGLPEVKTPQCLHITPGMMGSSSRNYDDRYVYQLQKRMKNKYQFNVHKHAPKNVTPPASVKKQKRCPTAGTDSFVVWEMFPDKEEAPTDSDEEQDFYFSDAD